MNERAPALWLFSTEGCHLCDDALDLLLGQPALAGMMLEVVDISEDDALVEQYGARIPVLRLTSGDELDWPFDAARVNAFVAGEHAPSAVAGSPPIVRDDSIV